MKALYPFRSRQHAGQLLAEQLSGYLRHPDTIVVALPRGGVVVGREIAKVLALPLDICTVRKLGLPDCPELAMGAIATGGSFVLNYGVIEEYRVNDADVRHVVSVEKLELQRREAAYREGRHAADLADQTVILTDDGVATGATVRAAIAAIRQRGVKRIVLAIPVGPPETIAELEKESEELFCLLTPPYFRSIGVWYEDFPQLDDEDVRRLLHEGQLHETPVM